VKIHLEMTDSQIVCKENSREILSINLKDFLQEITASSDHQILPEAIPEGVRFVSKRRDGVVLAIEEKPMARTVRWLCEDSPVPYGKGAQYSTVRLSFPFTILIVVFRGGSLIGHQQCFYRTTPLQKFDDHLFYPNLYNVAQGYGLPCWLCLANLKSRLSSLSWEEKVRTIRTHFWSESFNQSSEVHEGNSYWQSMRGIDSRVASLEAWSKETTKDPFFSLKVPWKPIGASIGEIMEKMLDKLGPPPLPPSVSVTNLIPLLHRRGKVKKRTLMGAFLSKGKEQDP